MKDAYSSLRWKSVIWSLFLVQEVQDASDALGSQVSS